MPRKLPLAGIRVANFGWGWLGPVAGQTLARLGAEVYKIESHARVDINRTIPPFATGHEKDPDCSLQNHAAWAGNGSVTFNLKLAEGQRLARELAAHCDLVLENFGPGVMKKLHLDYGHLKELRPDTLLISMPAAGLSGSLSHVRTYGMSLSSITGLDSLTGYPGGAPIPMENAFADPLGGVIGAFAAVLALNYRKRNGRGMHVDMSQQEGVMQLMGPAFMDYGFNGRIAAPMGNRHPQNAAAPHGVFPCAGEDRWLSLVVQDDAEWQALTDVLVADGCTWATNACYAHRTGRIEHVDALHEQLAAWTASHDDYHLAARLQEAGVAAAPVLNIADLLSDPHYRARRTFVEVDHPLGFKETVYGHYVKTVQGSDGVHDAPPLATGPAMGQDNERVCREILGLSAADYARLVEQQVIF